MPIDSRTTRPILNPIRPGPTTPPAVKLPSAKTLKSALGTYEFHNLAKWSTKKPAGAVLKEIVLEKPGKNPRPGSSTLTAYVLKSDPTKVYFGKAGSMAPHYFGPVSWQTLPKGTPGPILNPIRPR